MKILILFIFLIDFAFASDTLSLAEVMSGFSDYLSFNSGKLFLIISILYSSVLYLMSHKFKDFLYFFIPSAIFSAIIGYCENPFIFFISGFVYFIYFFTYLCHFFKILDQENKEISKFEKESK